MVRRDGAEARKERIAQIAKSIQAALFQNKEAGWISLSKIVSQIMIETGLTRNKVMEYLQLLSDAGQFVLDESNDKIRRV
jgi:hypothetical protein